MSYLKATLPHDVREYVVIQCKEGNNARREVATSDEPLTEFLANYAHDRYTSIKSLRIKYKDRTLFLSSIGRKTPRELGINDNDILEITIISTDVKNSCMEFLWRRLLSDYYRGVGSPLTSTKKNY